MGAMLVLAPTPALAAGETIEFASAGGSVLEDVTSGEYSVNAVLDTGGPATSVDAVSVTVSAPPSADYVLNTTSVTFPAGSDDGATLPVTLTITDDLIDEDDQPVVLTMTGPGAGGQDTHTVLIEDDDALPILSIEPASGEEGTVITFTVTKTGLTEKTVTVDTVTNDGTDPPAATSKPPAADFINRSDVRYVFPPSLTTDTQTLTVETLQDTLDEANETFEVRLSNPINATLAGAPPPAFVTGTGTIIDDDGEPSVSVVDATAVAEGPGASLKFLVSLLPASGQPVTVKYKTVDGTATAPADYTALPLTPLTFAPGETSREVDVPIADDTIDEIAETMRLELSEPTATTIVPGGGVATGTISDNDNAAPVIDKLLITDANGAPKTTFNRGETTMVNVEFSDPGVMDTHEVRVSWEDATPDHYEVIAGTGLATRSFVATHQYTDAAPQTITVIIDDGEGGQARKDAVTIFIVGVGGAQLETVGLVDPTTGLWTLRNAAGVETTFYYGNPGDFPIIGDWDCDGDETPGMYRQSDGFVYLRNSNTQGVADIKFFFGNPGDVPIVGDFNGDGCHTVSIYRPSESKVFIINKLGENNGGLGAAEIEYFFGNPGDKPFVGDFDGDGIETIGLHRESTGLVYFRNSHTQGVADNQFIFGDPGDRLVAGDWVPSAVDSPAVFRPSNTTFYFRHSNTQGNADNQFVWGEPPFLPVAGNFGLD
jgi:hypothetical protein